MKQEFAYTFLNKKTGKLETRDMRTDELIANKDMVHTGWIYTIELSEAIANEIRGGKTLKELAGKEGFPPLFMMYNWRSANPDFKKKLKDAEADRASYYHDEAVEIIKGAKDLTKDEVPANKMALDGYMKLMEKGDPEKYSPKPQVLHGGAAPAMIVINTGISREPITVEADYEKVGTNRRDESRLRGTHEKPSGERSLGSDCRPIDGTSGGTSSAGQMAAVSTEVGSESCEESTSEEGSKESNEEESNEEENN